MKHLRLSLVTLIILIATIFFIGGCMGNKSNNEIKPVKYRISEITNPETTTKYFYEGSRVIKTDIYFQSLLNANEIFTYSDSQLNSYKLISNNGNKYIFQEEYQYDFKKRMYSFTTNNDGVKSNSLITFDAKDRPVKQLTTNDSGKVTDVTTWEYNSDNNIIKETSQNENSIRTFTYDDKRNYLIGILRPSLIRFNSPNNLVRATYKTFANNLETYSNTSSSINIYDSDGKLIKFQSSIDNNPPYGTTTITYESY